MSDTFSVSVGNKGRVVVPAGIRHNKGWVVGTDLIAIETETGVLLTDRASLKRIVRDQLVGADLVNGLLAERRSAALEEDRSPAR